MRLYFGSAVPTVTTLMIAALLGFIGCTVPSINKGKHACQR